MIKILIVGEQGSGKSRLRTALEQVYRKAGKTVEQVDELMFMDEAALDCDVLITETNDMLAADHARTGFDTVIRLEGRL